MIATGIYFEYQCSTGIECFSLKGRAIDPPLKLLSELFMVDMFLMNPGLPVLAFFATSVVLIRLLSKEPYRKIDLLMVFWFWVPTLFFTAFSYQPERYYLMALPGLVWLSIYALNNLESIMDVVLNKRSKFWGVLVMTIGTFLGMTGFIPNLFAEVQIGMDRGVSPSSLVSRNYGPFILGASLLCALTIQILSSLRLSAFIKALKLSAYCMLGLSMLLSLYPLVSWALYPSYQLLHATQLIRSLGRDAILVGDWAPQLSLDAQVRAIYSNWNEGMAEELNLYNMRRMQPTHLVIVEGINKNYMERLDSIYPHSRSNEPSLQFPYGGKNVMVYDFRVTVDLVYNSALLRIRKM